MNGGNFSGFEAYERLPVEEWYEMLKVHNRVVERHNREVEGRQ
jgi:hypothetical protein